MTPSRHNERHVDYLHRSGRPGFEAVRQCMENWLNEVPHPHRRELATRLLSRDDQHFEAAFFELYLHALFRRLGFTAKLHPRAGNRGGRPDFLVRARERSAFLVEAATVGELSASASGARTLLTEVFDMLNAMPCPDYFFHVEHDGTPRTPIPKRRLRRVVAEFVATLDYERVRSLAARGGLELLPGVEFEHDGCAIRVSVYPVSPEHRNDPNHRPVGIIGPAGASWVDDWTPIRDKIRSKARRYGRIRRPLVIAINAAGRDVDHIDAMQALFGGEAYQFPVGPGADGCEPVLVRQRNGAWAGPRGPINRRVSAAIIVSSLLPWTVTRAEPSLYHNPWARYRLDDSLNCLNTYRPSADKMVKQEGRPIHELLELPPLWPMNLGG